MNYNTVFFGRVLQLTSYDEEQSDLDNLTVLKKLQNAIQNKLNAANDWLLVSMFVDITHSRLNLGCAFNTGSKCSTRRCWREITETNHRGCSEGGRKVFTARRAQH